MGDYVLSAYERPSYPGFSRELFDGQSKQILDADRCLASALDAASALVEKAQVCIKNDIHTQGELRDAMLLELKAALATQCARHVPSPDRHIGQSRDSI